MNDTVESKGNFQDEATAAAAPLPSFRQEIELFSAHMETIGSVMVGMVFAVQELTTSSKKKLEQFEKERCEIIIDGEDRTIRVPDSDFRAWRRLLRNFQQFDLSRTLVPRSLLVSVVSQYDAYLGRLLRVAFLRKPELLNSSDKKLSLETLTQFATIDQAREHILEKEVEAILRSSHADHFKWMERTFDLPLTKGLASFPVFIELTERRNLFVHTDGVVSSQYLSVCRQHKCALDAEVREGQRLDVPQKYFDAAHACVYEIGVKLGHVLWRKLFPGEREAADDAFISLTYDLVDHGNYELATRLLDFACQDFRKFHSEATQTILTVNRAQAYKWKGDDERCKKIMRAVDWSAKGDNFKIAEAVLRDDFETAAKIARRIGPNGIVTQNNYRDWPLFRQFRKSEVFLATYLEIFGEPFSRKSEVKEKNIPTDSGEPPLERPADESPDAA